MKAFKTSSWLLLFFVAHWSASAFDILPEYQGITEGDVFKFEKPQDIDSEYQLIANAYEIPFNWEKQWYSTTRTLDLTVGSLSNKYFLNYSRAKFESDLSETLKFQFHYLSQQDNEIDQVRHILELSWRLGPWLRINGYGEPALYKRQNDMGLALEVQPTKNFHNRVYYTDHDISRNDHNNLRDHFASGSKPASMGWTGRGMIESVYVRTGFRYDQLVRWIRPEEYRDFYYYKKLAFGDAEWDVTEKERVLLRFQWDETFKQSAPTHAASSFAGESWKVRRTFVKSSYRWGVEEDPITLEPALMLAMRQWFNKDEASLTHANILPALTTRVRGFRRGDRFDHVQVNVEANFFEKKDEHHLTTAQLSSAIEGRFQAAYEFNFRSNTRLLMAFNFDLDQWNVVPTFEGGNVQFRTDF